jgi:two-component system response regulator QseB
MSLELSSDEIIDAGAITVSARRARVLVAEDDRELRGLIVAGLRADGYEVEEVDDGYDLLVCASRAALPSVGFDLIVSDVALPGLSALDVIAALRNPERRTRFTTPIVLITAFADADTRAEAQRLHAVLFDKPFDLDDLRTLAVNLVDPLLPAPGASRAS